MSSHRRVRVHTGRRRAADDDPTPFPPDAADPTDPADPALDDGAAHDAAVEEARAVLAAGWSRWVEGHGLDPAPELRCGEPRVSLVGEAPANYRLVALIRFTFTAAGTAFDGFARGPIEAPYFAVQRTLGPGEQGADGARRRWWRRP